MNNFKIIPPFFMNSVPKSGTHLLHQLLTGIPQLSMDISNDKKKFFIDDKYFLNIKNFEDHYNRLNSLSDNEFGLGHVWFTQEYVNILKKLKMKHIFLYRDPRDVLVSMSYFILRHWKDHPFHEDFNNLATFKERHLTLIHGVKEKWLDFYSYISPFYKWIDDKNTHHISFEELTHSVESRAQALSKLAMYLHEELTLPVDLEHIVNSMIANNDPQTSNTFRSGKIGSWKLEFDEELKKAFKNNSGELLIKYGYEKNNDW
ncbi:sulfotransferase domain-containing protein [Peribacillus frigoritolerans]|uniref:sulfotransferase domain-containing protein n=1 Tax=Peribacillus frigoritolerans TaxID=450367 RepID=UPI0023DB83F2|nr:sulfotransferase domain-containing protein [Peribacillus frigoritolerans]MDF1996308.1 sulfotransferase domain-containing protein [Peribacillus frigoritolerans]